MARRYVHGHHRRARQRLRDQASALVDLLHHDTRVPSGKSRARSGMRRRRADGHARASEPGRILRGSSTRRKPPSPPLSGRRADAGLGNVEFQQADIFDLPFRASAFDHVFVCFVLEHLVQPLRRSEPGRSRETRRIDHRDRGRPRLRLFPSGYRGPRGPSSNVRSSFSARAGGNALSWASGLPADGRRGIAARAGHAPDGLRGRQSARRCEELHEPDVHRDGGRTCGGRRFPQG